MYGCGVPHDQFQIFLLQLPDGNVATCIQDIIEKLAIHQYFQERDTKEAHEQRSERLQALVEEGSTYEHLGNYLDHIAVSRPSDEGRTDVDGIQLMSLHASRGRSFSYVFIMGCEDGLIPLERRGVLCDYEEERRLLYIGVTRAQKALFFCSASERMCYGRMVARVPSRYIV